MASKADSQKFLPFSISHKYTNKVTVLAVVVIGLALGVGVIG